MFHKRATLKQIALLYHKTNSAILQSSYIRAFRSALPHLPSSIERVTASYRDGIAIPVVCRHYTIGIASFFLADSVTLFTLWRNYNSLKWWRSISFYVLPIKPWDYLFWWHLPFISFLLSLLYLLPSTFLYPHTEYNGEKSYIFKYTSFHFSISF